MGVASHRFDNDKRRRSEDHDRQVALTPDYVLGPVRRLLGAIDMDPCTESDNPIGAVEFYCLPQDGCALPWKGETVFCNPPYGSAKDRWITRCIAEGRKRKVVLLIPSHSDTLGFQKALWACSSVIFIRSRLRFGMRRANGQQETASHGSALFGFGVDLSPLWRLGVPLKVSMPQQI